MATKDKTPPKLTSISPNKNSTGVAISQNLVLTFNKDIKTGNGNITISNGMGDTRIISVNSSLNEVSINANILKINPANDLLPNNHYAIKIDNTAIQDLSGNLYAGIKNTTTFYFDTVDTLAPVLIKSNPSANISNIASNSNIVLTFNEKIQAGTGSISLISGIDTRTIAITDKQITISGKTLTLNPSIDLNTNSIYKVHIDAGAVKDQSGVTNANDAINFSFTTKITGDKHPPILQSYLGNGTVNDGIKLTFQEGIKIGKGNLILSDGTTNFVIPVNDSSQISVSNNVLMIHPKQNFIAEKTYILTAPKGFVTDLASNAFAGLTTKKPFTYDTHSNSSSTSTNNGTSNIPSNNITVLVKSNGSGDATKGANVYDILAGNYTYIINEFATDDKLKFFLNASLNVIPDVNQQDGVQEINAIDRATGSTTVIRLTGLTLSQDDGIFNLPSFLNIFPYGINH
jgi:methionine-rich copper-binding protein CopC